jgi:hypothetical protein
MMNGVMGGADMLTFIPLALTSVKQQSEMMEYVNSFWGTDDTS